MPEVELPPSEGEDIFKGRTFSDGSDQYVFSTDGTFARMGKGSDFQYMYSVNRDGELCIKLDKWGMAFGSAVVKWLSFDEMVQYVESGEYFADERASALESVKDIEGLPEWMEEHGMTNYKEYVEYVISQEKSFLDMQKKYGYPSWRNEFAYRRYAVEERDGRFVLTEQYEASSAWFRLRNGSEGINGLAVCPGVGIAGFEPEGVDSEGNGTYFYSYSVSDGKILFVNEKAESMTFPATYTISGSGNDTTLEMSFEYGGVQYDETLDFDPGTLYLTKVEAAASSPQD
ncbi:MAG: hypothetical protein K2H09_04785 [Treponemataceae bacterium]|nr:hypothetical protein [Treponemataceae bacterium]